MKKRKAFTLIEVLAVIIIISIIALITIPVITNIIGTFKESALVNSANNIAHAAELKFSDNFSGPFQIVYENGVITSSDTLKLKGSNPENGIVNVNAEGLVALAIYDSSIKKCVLKEYTGDVSISTAETYEECLATSPIFAVDLFQQVVDTNPGVICGATLAEDYANNTTCNVNSIEDLIQLSNLSKTNTFSGKTVLLNYNIDFQNDKSYINPNTTVFGDINGNGSVESLKVELTTSKGFFPIGGSTANFSGIFNGNAKIIKNLYINRPGVNNIGLFGVLSGVAKGLIIENASISGGSYVAVLAGQLTGGVTTVNISGDVVATGSYVALLAGFKANTVATNSAVVAGNVVGVDYISGAISYIANSSNLSSIIYKSGSVSGTGTYIKRMSTYNAIPNALAYKNILVNSVTVSSNAFHGNSIESLYLNDINMYETLGFDTYIGGDNDGDGYYFDYDLSGNLTVMQNSSNVLLAGSGTIGDPYLISNYLELRQVSKNPASNYKLTNDIDLTNKKSYMLGSNTNRFSGTFDGNGKTINGYRINGSDYSSIFGHLTGTVKGLKITDAAITGNNYTAVLAGVAAGSITSTYVNGSIVSSGSYVALLVGQRTGSGVIGNNVVEGTVSGVDYVSGVISYLSTSTNIGPHVYKSGSVTGTGTYVKRFSTYNAVSIALANSSILVNGVAVTPGAFHGTDKPIAHLDDLNIYETLGFDTYIGGDNDNDGYVFDYDNDGNLDLLKYDSTITMSGSGTTIDPYLISNYLELKQASKNPTLNYKLINDIDLTNKKSYMLGSNANKFSGTFDGNGKIIDGFTINGNDYLGIFGYLTGTVKGLNIKNADINSFGYYTGIVAGICNNCSITQNYVNGDVSSESDYASLLVSHRSGTNLVAYNVVEGNVVGKSHTSGILSYVASSTNLTSLVYKSGSVTAIGSYIHRASTYNALPSAYANQSILVNGVTTGTGGFDGTSVSAANLLLQSTYVGYGFNFTDTTAGTYIWKISGSNIWVEKN